MSSSTFRLGVPITQTMTNEFGYYSIWLDQRCYDVEYSADGYITSFRSVEILPGQVTTNDILLLPDRPCITIEPNMIEAWVLTDTLEYDTGGLQITNMGAQDLTFEISEKDLGFLPAANVPVYVPPETSNGSAQGLSQFANSAISGNTKILPVPEQEILLHQPPNQVNGLFANSDCSLCGTGQQSIAENFTLPDGGVIGQIVFWTGYFPGDIPMETDAISVIFHADSAGTPGAALYTEDNVEYTREQTGVILFGVHEWMHTLTLGSPVSLDPGNYWVEIFNHTTGNSDQFFWETGDLDPVDGLAGSAWTTATPGQTWNFDGATDLAIQLITGTDGGVPWVWENPISGTVTAGGFQDVEVMFTSQYTDGTPMPLGTYTATLRIVNNDAVAGVQNVPVTMHIVEEYLPPVVSFTSNSPVMLGTAMEFTNTSDRGIPPAKESIPGTLEMERLQTIGSTIQ